MSSTRSISNLLVTGGAGFIGSAFIRYLLSPEINFKGLCINLDALTYAGNLTNLKNVEKDSRYLFEHGNIANEAYIEHLCQEHAIDAIIHFAAESHVDRSILGPKTFLETNVIGTFHLLEIVRRNPHIHFHHVSTDEVYGSLGETGLFTETTPYQPNSPYSASKAAADHFVRAYHRTYGISACISNCSNNYGPYQFPEKLIPVMILNCLEKKTLPIYGKGMNVRDWLYVEDHAKALWLLLNKGKAGKTYNIGGEAEKRNIDLIAEIIKTVADLQNIEPALLKSLITFVKDRPGHDLRYAIDCSKIKNELGWLPSHTFCEGLKKTIIWYMENLEWVGAIQNSSYSPWIETN